MNRTQCARGIAAVLLFGAASQGQAVTWQTGDWTLGLGGNVNAFYTVTQCDDGDFKSGGPLLK